MHRFAVLLLLLLLPADALAQYNPYAPGPVQLDPRTRRALREQAVAYAGQNSRAFVEKYDEAVAAIGNLTPGGARKLVEFHNSGNLDKLPRPADFLKCIALPGNGDDALSWAALHARELTDVDNFDAFLLAPLEYAFALKPLEQGAAEARARRLASASATTPAVPPGIPIVPTPAPATQLSVDNRVLGVVGGGLILVLVIVAWKRRQSGGMGI